jgi:DNA replication initiation complex subunit (GINS family)
VTQPLEALKLANDVRKKRALLKLDIKRDPKKVLDLLKDPPDFLYTMKIETLLMAMPRFGKSRVTKIMRAARMASKAQVGDLTAQRRDELSFVIRRYLPK